jgi:hypothetical protein
MCIMNKMGEVAKILGLELDEVFKIAETSCDYKIANEGVVYRNMDRSIDWLVSNYMISDFIRNPELIIKQIKQPWLPVYGETYYYPMLSVESLCMFDVCANTDFDYHIFNKKLCFKTKEEAVEAAKKMLKSLE